MPVEDYDPAELVPRKLNREEIDDPYQVIADLFNYGHLPEIREQLWELLKAAITGNYCHDLDRRDRSNLLHFYEHLEKLIEVAHIIYQKNKTQK